MNHLDAMMEPGYDPDGFRPEAGRLRVFCGGSGSNKAAKQAAAREAARQARITSATSAINKMFGQGDDPEAQANLGGRNTLYDSVRTDTRDFYTQQLAEDRAEAERQLRFNMARGGTFGGSQAIDMESEFNRRNDRGLLDVANRADSAATGMKTADEQSRLGLLSRILSDMDQGSAVSSAISQMQGNVETSRQNAMAGRMINVFADLFKIPGMAQQQAGIDAARRTAGNQTGNYFDNSRTQYSGSTSP